MKIKFIETRHVEAQGEIVQTFNAGEVYELESASARRWLRRNVATEVQGSVKSEATKSADKDKPIVKKKRKYTRREPITSTKAAPKPDDSDTGGRAEPDAGTGKPDTGTGNNSDK